MSGSSHTLLHTSYALLAMARTGTPEYTAIRDPISEYLLSRLVPGQFTEVVTQAEDYDVPFTRNGEPDVYQMTLPHFAMPIAIHALLETGHTPHHTKIYECIESIIAEQHADGHWILPRSPSRPSVWALWPFLAALSSFRQRCLPTPSAQVTLLYDGVALQQTDPDAPPVTRGMLLRGAAAQWLRERWRPLIRLTIAFFFVVLSIVLLALGSIDLKEFSLSLVVPVLLLVYELVGHAKSAKAP